MKTIFIALFACVLMSSCASKVGSDAWCAKLKIPQRPTGL